MFDCCLGIVWSKKNIVVKFFFSIWCEIVLGVFSMERLFLGFEV